MKNLEEVIISVIKGAEEVEAEYKWNGRRYVTSNGMTGKLVRCKECKHKDEIVNYCYENDRDVNADDYCSYGERKSDE